MRSQLSDKSLPVLTNAAGESSLQRKTCGPSILPLIAAAQPLHPPDLLTLITAATSPDPPHPVPGVEGALVAGHSLHWHGATVVHMYAVFLSSSSQHQEASRMAAHEELEAETIETSKLRHQVLRQRDDIMSEVSAGVAAARAASAAQLNQLQMEIESTEQEIEFIEKKRKLLEEQNTVLTQDRDLLKSKHADVIAQLNVQLSDRANRQIALNEALNEIQFIKEKITQMGTARKDLGEDMVKERIKFAERKNMLEAEIKETMNSIQQQKKTDTSMCRGLNVISAVLINKDEQVKDLSKRISKLEKNITRLTASQLKCHEEHEHKCKKSEEIARKRELYEKELQDVRKTFQQKIKAVREKIPELETEIEEGRKVNSDHLESITKLSKLNSRKNNLEISIQEVKEQTATLLGSKVEIKQELEALRAKHRETLANQAAEISATEKSIYENGLMLEQVNMENSRLHLCIEQLKEEISNAKKDKEKYTQEMTWMQQEVQALCRSLMEDWVIDKLVTEESTERDKKVLESMHGFMVMIRTRMHQIGEINSRVEKELAAMSSLWENTKPQ
ncbi:hypothetical protein P4O66_001629 [Electrophorus voltai]|uniref:Uncharacterized protein n=1 Tax=Electrophorus voltai TaxID=2609070 RepID=A0AAD8Z4C7_9TELE|nr:hypothetical protein P4O66_001629 [Electrophorus voltai]